eukprot:TRINITY_DN6339_c0_g1_i1.p1 TRINITY_DN6339_c0_g1~~TRINITY_DN6339_c0_g1_i1.p1  ORF type:complete len:283 (+),score=79.14 TRINITY_DN6339_c0_g1_i1:32-850(+)
MGNDQIINSTNPEATGQEFELEERNMEYYMRKVKEYETKSEFKKALDMAKIAHQKDPNDSLMIATIGYIYFIRQKYKKALHFFNEAIKLDIGFAMAYLNRGNTHLRLGDKDKALEDFSTAITINKEFESAYFARGNSCIEMNKLEEAEKDLKTCVSLAPNKSRSHIRLGLIYHKQGNHEKAMYAITNGLLLDQKDKYGFVCKGDLMIDMKDYNTALEAYNTAIEIDVKYVKAYQQRAKLYDLLLKKDLAEKDRETIEKLTFTLPEKDKKEKK